MNKHSFDDLERRDPSAREAALMAALSAQVAHAKASSPAQAERLRQVDPASVTSRQALAALPVLRKGELLQAQMAARESGGGDPFAGFSASGWNGLRYPRPAKRVFQSPGPLYEPQGHHPGSPAAHSGQMQPFPSEQPPEP
jgi:phenylacetate-CoA ligase